MTGKIWCPLVIGAVMLSMLAACNTSDNDITADNDIEYGMTEGEAAQMEELGYISIDNVADASRIAGYPVAVPTYLPEDFTGGVFSVSQFGLTFPGQSEPAVKAFNVFQYYWWQEDESVRLSLIQVKLVLGLGDSEPTEFCGHSGQRYYREAEGDMAALVVLGWEVDGVSYYLSGTLAGPLDEATLEQIACSIEVNK